MMENKQSEKMLLIDSQKIEEKTFEFQTIGFFYPTKTWLEAKYLSAQGPAQSGVLYRFFPTQCGKTRAKYFFSLTFVKKITFYS